MRIVILGCGSGIPILGHFNESVFIETQSGSYLFDAGESCAATMHTNTLLSFQGLPQLMNIPVVDIYSIKSIFISHMDADHVGGLPMLLQTMDLWQKRADVFMFKPENGLMAYLPVETIETFKAFLDVLNLTKLRYRLEILPISKGVFHMDEIARVSAVQNTHRKGQSYSFVLEAEGKRIAYSGDMGNELEVLPLLEHGVDLAIVECAHFPAESLFRTLHGKEESLKRLVLNHFHPNLYGHEEEIASLGRKYLNCDIIAGRDNLEITI